MSFTQSPQWADWVRNSGIHIKSCEIRGTESSGSGLFLIPDRDEQGGERNDDDEKYKQPEPGPTVLLKIPKNLLITQNNILEFSKSRPFLKNLLFRTDIGESPAGDSDALLTPPPPRKCLTRFLVYLLLCSKRGTPDPDFEPWFKSLPAGRDIRLPFTWPDEDLEQLERSSIFYAVIAKKSALRLSYTDFFSSKEFTEEIAQFVKSGPKNPQSELDTQVTFHDFQLIEEWILSRSCEIRTKNRNPDEDQQQRELDIDVDLELALVPILDFCNHDSKENAYYELDNDGNVDLLLKENSVIPSPGQITINYGPNKSAGEFLFNYGFIPNDYQTAKGITRHYSVEDKYIVELLDPEIHSDPNIERVPYDYLQQFLDRPINKFTISYSPDVSPKSKSEWKWPRWHDDLIYLLACEDDLILNMEEGYLTLFFDGWEVDLNDVETFLFRINRTKFLSEIVPRADKIARRFLKALLIQIESGGEIGKSAGLPPYRNNHQLVKIEKILITNMLKVLEEGLLPDKELGESMSALNLKSAKRGT